MTDGQKIDLDALVAAHNEEIGEGPVVGFGGQDFRLPPEIPLEVSYHNSEATGLLEEASKLKAAGKTAAEITPLLRAADRAGLQAFKALLGETGFQDFMRLGATEWVMIKMLQEVLPLYGSSSGESQASAESSETTGEPSRPTSSTTTE